MLSSGRKNYVNKALEYSVTGVCKLESGEAQGGERLPLLEGLEKGFTKMTHFIWIVMNGRPRNSNRSTNLLRNQKSGFVFQSVTLEKMPVYLTSEMKK